jgi:cyclopropane fatty-acyl-phospholipid synthase-like methyltransferase
LSAGNAGQVTYWNGPIGKVWAKEQVKRDRDHAAITRAALDLAAPLPGHHVLDIGCGSGTTTLLIADAVGDEGSVTGIDLSAPCSTWRTTGQSKAGAGRNSSRLTRPITRLHQPNSISPSRSSA